MRKRTKSLIGIRLREFRNNLGLSVTDVAQGIGVSVSTYREWENGRAISGEPYADLAKILQVSLSELLTGKPLEASNIFKEFGELEDQLKKFKETLYSSF